MLINCVAYQEGRKLADIGIGDIRSYLERPGCFVWVALRDPSPRELEGLQDEFELHPLAIEDAQKGHQRPKLEEYGEHLFMVMQLLEPGAEGSEAGEVAVFVGRNFVLSVRNRSGEGFLGVRERCEREPELLQLGAGFVFYALMDAVVDRYFPLLAALEDELEAIEAKIFARRAARRNIERLYALKRRVNQLRHAVTPLQEAAGKLHGGRVPPVCQGTQEYFRDVHDHLARITAGIDTARDTIGTAIQVNVSMVAIEQGETTRKLAAWAAIFGVCTALVGIWGMNFRHMPELDWEWGYPMALSLIAGSAAFLYWRFKRARWL